jgi:predicted nuclease of restriction endonuclease-like (RecB) superfamily
LGWTHFTILIPIKDPLKREFYAEMCRVERWSVRQLRERIDSMLFERTALSKKPEALIRKELSALREKGELSPDRVFRDPYMLDFLDLADTYSEKDLEAAILREIERVVLELGAGFAFVERQKRISLDGDDYHLDLLFFHRRLRRLVAIELKLGDFKPADSGQMELYLRWLNRHERQPDEQAPLGIILCAGKKRETVEYLDLGARGIHVAEHLTELPAREELEKRLHRAVVFARERLALGSVGEER